MHCPTCTGLCYRDLNPNACVNETICCAEAITRQIYIITHTREREGRACPHTAKDLRSECTLKLEDHLRWIELHKLKIFIKYIKVSQLIYFSYHHIL